MPVVSPIPETPEQEVVEFRNTASYTIPEAARKAHRLLLDLEIISVTRTQYVNLQYNLPQGEYANVTFWNGASISRTEKIKYPSQRLIDWVNVEAGISNIVGGTGYVILQTLEQMAIALGLVPVEGDRSSPNTWGYPVSHLKIVAYPDTQFRLTCQWYPFVDYPNVEETNPDLDDPAQGENEYPSPRRNPPDDPWKDNDPASPPDPQRDARDYSSDNDPPPPVDPEAGNINTWKIHVSSQYFTGDAYFVCRGTPSISRGDDGRVVDATGGDPNQPASSGATITARMFGGVDASSTVEVSKV